VGNLDGRRATLVAGGAGVLWPVLALARVPLTRLLDQPSWDADRSSIVQFYSDSNFSGGFVGGMALVSVAYVLFVVFAAKVADLVGEADASWRWVGRLIVAGAALDTALVFAYLAPFGAAVFWAGHGGLTADSYLTLHGLSFSFLWLELLTMTLWMVPFGLAVVRTGLFPKWLGWLLLANAGGTVLSFFLPYSSWAVTGGLPYLWVFIAAGLMVIHPHRYSGTTHP
jgi:hypothetical protein